MHVGFLICKEVTAALLVLTAQVVCSNRIRTNASNMRMLIYQDEDINLSP